MRRLGKIACAGVLAGLAASAAAASPTVPFASEPESLGGADGSREPKIAQAIPAPGLLHLDFDSTVWSQRGLRFADDAAHLVLPLWPEPATRVWLGDGAPTGWKGRLMVPGLRLARGDGEEGPALHLVPGGAGVEADLVDGAGAVWARLRAPMRSPDPADGWRLITANLEAGPALATWLAMPVEGSQLAGVSMRLPLASSARPKTCSAPDWPGTAGFDTDVLLTSVAGVRSPRCKQSSSTALCDGPGGDSGSVVLVANATLRNQDGENAADVPWYQQFSGPRPPYDNDQHPFLVWNLYRMDAQGRLSQIGRSALKHAFATANTDCTDATCGSNSTILGRGCSDLYPVSSNECNRFLAPRDEVWPSRGIWGRCGSLFDADCDGFADPRGGTSCGGGSFCGGTLGSPANDCYGLRLVVDERDLDPSEHPGARWFFDSWYVVRDDENLFNTMGWREVTPSYVAGSGWRFDELPYQVGAVAEWWSSLQGDTQPQLWSLLDAEEGQLGVGSRVTRLGPASYRYDYVVMNFSLTRPVTDGSEPNLRILSNLGVNGLRVPKLDAALVATDFAFDDGDRDAGNDWTMAEQADAWRWAAPMSGHLPWGSLIRVSLTSTKPPVSAALQLEMAETGSPGEYAAMALVPDPFVLLRDGFEE